MASLAVSNTLPLIYAMRACSTAKGVGQNWNKVGETAENLAKKR